MDLWCELFRVDRRGIKRIADRLQGCGNFRSCRRTRMTNISTGDHNKQLRHRLQNTHHRKQLQPSCSHFLKPALAVYFVLVMLSNPHSIPRYSSSSLRSIYLHSSPPASIQHQTSNMYGTIAYPVLTELNYELHPF